MKKAKKLTGILLLVAMLFMIAAPAMAVQTVNSTSTAGGSATITIKNATKGATYTVYKVFDATVNDSGAINYTKDNFIGNNYFQVDEAGNITATEAAYETGSTEKLSADAIAWIKSNNTAEVASATATDSELKFQNLTYGYYYITSTVKDEAAITVTSTNPNAEVIDKNQGEPGWTPDDGDTKHGKSIIAVNNGNLTTSVDQKDVNIGDTVTFRLEINATNYVGEQQIKEYIISDTLADTFTFGNVTAVKVKDISGVENKLTVDKKDYTNNNFPTGTIVIPWVDDSNKSIYDTNAVIIIEYTATLNTDAVIDENGNVNTAGFTWKYTDDTVPKDPDDPDEPKVKTETATVYTYAIALKKVDQDGNSLAGATFQFPFYVQETVDDDGAYIYAGKNEAEGLTKQITSPASGEITIKGVASGDYSITEVKAPDGYNKLASPVSVKAEKLGATETNTAFYLDKNGEISSEVTETLVTYTNDDLAATAVVVVNKTGSVLPSTGGIGTTIFYAVGGVLVVGAGVLLITRKRMSVEK